MHAKSESCLVADPRGLEKDLVSHLHALRRLVSKHVNSEAHSNTHNTAKNNTHNQRKPTNMGKSIRRTKTTYDLWGKKVELCIPKDCFPTKKELEALDKPLMPGCQHKWFQSKHNDGAWLHYIEVTKPTNGSPKGIIVFQHGINANAGAALVLSNGKKTNMALMRDYCQEQGFALYGLDMYGHGFSEGYRMLVPTYQSNRDDLVDFCNERVAEIGVEDVPLFVLGHSYGGNVTLHAAKYWQDHPDVAPKGFKGIMLMAPAVIAELPPKPILGLLKNKLAPKHPYWVPFFMPNPVTAKRIWRDPEVYKLNMHPKKDKWGIDDSSKALCLGTGVQLLDAMEEAKNNVIPNLTIPLCCIHGRKDKAVLVDSTEYIEKHCPSEQKTIVYIPEAYHDILADPDSDKAMDAIRTFIQTQLAE